MAKKKTGPARVDERLKLSVDFGGVSFGDSTARLGLVIDRQKIDLESAIGTFCGRRVTGTVVVGGDDMDQTTFLDDAEYRIASVFDIKAINVKPKSFGLGLTFSLEEIDAGDLAHFAKKKGMLRVDMSAPLPEKATKASSNGDTDDEDDDEEEDE